MVGNKYDQKKAAEVTDEEVEEYANKKGMLLHFCSAYDGNGIEDIFKNIAIDYVQQK